MLELRVIHNCDHKVKNKDSTVTSVTLTKGSGLYDNIGLANVVFIVSITCNDTVLSPEIYNLYNDRVVWTKTYNEAVTGIYRVPAISDTYTVALKYIDATLTIYFAENCPRCNGTGWYINLMDNGTTLCESSGAVLVAQNFLKALLTVPGTDRTNAGFGAGLMSDAGVLYFDNRLDNTIRTAVLTAELQTKELEIVNGISDPSELLDTATVTSIEQDPKAGAIFVTIRLVTLDGSVVNFTI